MDIITREEVKELCRHAEAPCVSIHMPTHRTAGSTVEDRLRFKNLVGEAQDRLTGAGMRRPEAVELLGPLHKLHRDDAFWMRTLEGLAAFVAPGFFRRYALPAAFAEHLDAGERFQVRPLAALLPLGGRYHVLAVDKNGSTLHEGDGYELRALELPPATPRSLADVLRLYSLENLLDFHTRTPHVGAGGLRTAVFHSDKETEIALKQRVAEYFRLVDRGVARSLREKSAPLVLVGVEYLTTMYREVSSQPHLFAESVVCSPERLTAAELHKRTWALVGAHFDKPRRDALAAFPNLLSAGKATGDPEEVLVAAGQGRVWSLLCLRDERLWGTFDAARGRLDVADGPRPGATDVSNLAAIMAIETGAAVHEAAPGELPAGVAIGALLRS